MTKFMSLFLTAALCLTLAACGNSPAMDAAAPEVFFTSDISSAGLIKAYEALNWTPTGKTAVKLSTGEPPNRTICGRI
ncbi:MAG: hypothetical protein IJQ81_13065 [Oscillibacter sp.]|nr:hypothetical protein [Oscillibacter sp.]